MTNQQINLRDLTRGQSFSMDGQSYFVVGQNEDDSQTVIRRYSFHHITPDQLVSHHEVVTLIPRPQAR